MFKLTPSKFVFWNDLQLKKAMPCWREAFQKEKRTGLISSGAQSRINLAIDWLLHLSPSKMTWYHELGKKYPFKIGFLTLTLPASQVSSVQLPCGKFIYGSDVNQCFAATNIGFGKVIYRVTDNQIKHECLNQFIIECRKKFHLKNFVWKAESQRNGNIHFHFTLDKYIFYPELRSIWNRIIEKFGFISRYQKEWKGLSFEDYLLKRGYKKGEVLDKYRKAYRYGNESNWREPNTVEIHSVRKVKNLRAYLAKYFNKNNLYRRLIEGNIWRLSEQLSKYKGLINVVSGQIANEINLISKRCKNSWFHKDFIHILKEGIDTVAAYIPNGHLVRDFINYKNLVTGQTSTGL